MTINTPDQTVSIITDFRAQWIGYRLTFTPSSGPIAALSARGSEGEHGVERRGGPAARGNLRGCDLPPPHMMRYNIM